MKPESLLPENYDFRQETYDAVCSRYAGFGRNLFATLREAMPSAFNSLLFYRASVHQESDVYAVCHWAQTNFAIQLDPYCEVIVLWDHSTQIEIGTWESDPSLTAMEFIRRNFMNSATT